jgi:subtilisin-like proprotein convertase family protein
VQPGAAIPDNVAQGVDSDIVLAAGGDVRDLNVSVRIDHTFVSDLRITLKHVPSGTSIPLYVPAADCPTDNLDIDFDDQAVDGYAKARCSGAAPAVSGRLLGNEWLSVLRGKTRAGPWRLNVADVKAADSGTLVAWCVDAR